MKSGDKVTHKNKKFKYRGIGEVGFVSDSGLVFVKWPNAEIKTYRAYFKTNSLVPVEVAQ